MSKYKIVTHVHTKYSHDSILPFFLLYWRCLKCGIQYIAITEHNNITGARKFQEYCQRHGDKLKVILGEEIMTTGGEIIGLYLHDNIPPMLTPGDTIQKIKRQGGLVCVPHPYDVKRYKTVLKEEYIKEFKSQIDCIECHNGRNISKDFDRVQNEIAEKYSIKKIIGADAHTFFEIGRNYMEMDYAPDNQNGFMKSLDHVILYKDDCLNFCHQLTRLDRIIKFLQKGDFYGLLRVVFRRFAS